MSGPLLLLLLTGAVIGIIKLKKEYGNKVSTSTVSFRGQANKFPFKKLLLGAVAVFALSYFIDPIKHLLVLAWDIRPTDENRARWEKEHQNAQRARRTDWPCTYDLSLYSTDKNTKGRHIANHDAKLLKPDDRGAWQACLFDIRKPEDMSNEQLNNFWKDRFSELDGNPSEWDVIVVRSRSSGTVSCILRDQHNNGYFREQFSQNGKKHEGKQDIEIFDVSRRLITGGDPLNETPPEKAQVFRITC